MTDAQRYRSLITRQRGQITYRQLRQMLGEQGIAHQTIPDTGKRLDVTDTDAFLSWILT